MHIFSNFTKWRQTIDIKLYLSQFNRKLFHLTLRLNYNSGKKLQH